MSAPRGAWARPLAARKLHYFIDGSHHALCGGYMTIQVKPSDFAKGARDDEVALVERCPTCERKLGYFAPAASQDRQTMSAEMSHLVRSRLEDVCDTAQRNIDYIEGQNAKLRDTIASQERDIAFNLEEIAENRRALAEASALLAANGENTT